MILDAFVIAILVISVWSGRKTGLFRTVARFLSFGLSVLFTSIWGDAVHAYAVETSTYEKALEKVTVYVENALAKGETAILKPFLLGETLAQNIAENMLHAIISILCFVVFLLLVRILIVVVDKLIFQLPLVRSMNHALGMALSFVFAAAVLYLVVGALGSISFLSEGSFLGQQMQSSVLVKYMYENNWVLNLILGKG